MSRKWLFALPVTLVLTVAVGAFAVRGTSGSPAAQLPTLPPTVDAGLPHREADGEAEGSTISFIDSPSATCYRPAVSTGDCYIQWGYLSVTAASAQYVISMTVTIGDRLRAYHSGFFQTAMYIPGDMTDPGFKVTCGKPGSGGDPQLGQTYSYVIRARETGGLSAANYGSVKCPADTVNVLSPLIVLQTVATKRHIQFEAESGQIISPMAVATNASASGGRFVHTPPDLFGGEARWNVQIPQAGKYAIWGRVWGLDSGHDSFWVSVDGGSESQWSIPHNAWTWSRVSHWNGSQNVLMTYDLPAGAHQLRIRTREHGSRLDVLHVTNDLGWMPQ